MKPASTRWLTGAEVLAVSLLITLSTIVVAVYLFDRVGLAFTPHRMLVVAAAAAIVAFVWLGRSAAWGVADITAFVAVVGSTFGWVMWLARPDFLPLGSGPDLTHHLLLIGFIERHWTLVHDATVEWAIGDMVQYTPGSQALTALAGAWSGSDGLHALHPLLAATFALKIGFVFLVMLRLTSTSPPSPAASARIPLALGGIVLLGLPLAYVLGSFAHYSFVAQAVAELFAVGMWWTLTVWDESPGWRPMAIFALAGSAAFLTWPVWVGAPIAALVVLGFLHDHVPMRERAVAVLIACVPIGIVAVLYTIGRLGFTVIIRTGGDVLAPSLRVYGIVFLALTAAGILAAVTERRARATIVFTGALVLEAVALFALARTRRVPETPYMALKMFYLLVYPQAALAALALAAAFGGATRYMMQSRPARAATSGWATAALWVLVAALAAGVAPVARATAATLDLAPAVSQPLFLAGTWAREHVPPTCVEYLVGDRYSAYWLHLSVLGNQWMSSRTGDDATFNQRDAIIRWLTPGGLRYAVVDLATLPADVRGDLDIIASFGSAAVAQRRGPSSCPGT